MKSTFKILFILRNRLNKDGLATLTIRITVNEERTEINSTIYLNPKDWDQGCRKVRGKSKHALEINNSIDNIRDYLNSLYREIQAEDGTVQLQKLRDRFLGVKEKAYSLLDHFDKIIAQKNALADKTITKDTVDKYRCSKSKVEIFIKSHYKEEDIELKELNYDFINNYKVFLLSEGKCEHNTMVRHMRYLKQVTTDAIKCNLIPKDPFYGLVLSSKRGKRKYLTEPELLTMMRKTFENQVLEEVRDIFVFSCFTGLPYVDIKSLSVTDIMENQKGQKFISKDRQKTGNESYIPLLDMAEQIINKYKERNLPEGRIFPVSACQVMNRYIKEIAALCNINKNLSTHCGRHTYATLMLTKGISVESVSKMLGHTDIRTTQIYAAIMHEKVDSEMDNIRNKFDYLPELAKLKEENIINR